MPLTRMPVARLMRTSLWHSLRASTPACQPSLATSSARSKSLTRNMHYHMQLLRLSVPLTRSLFSFVCLITATVMVSLTLMRYSSSQASGCWGRPVGLTLPIHTQFHALNKRYPMILYPAFRMQSNMQRATLGTYMGHTPCTLLPLPLRDAAGCWCSCRVCVLAQRHGR